MQDALKLAEEALVLVRGEVEHSMTTQSQDAYVDALTAIRTARAEWVWRPIAEMTEQDKSVVCGKWIKLYRKWEWVTQDGWGNKKAARMTDYTHFYRPQLPAPPKEGE